jgi:hypothetical protein
MAKAPPVKIKKESPDLYFALIGRELAWSGKDLFAHGTHTNSIRALAGMCKLGGYDASGPNSDLIAGFMTSFYDESRLRPWRGPHVVFKKTPGSNFKEVTVTLSEYERISLRQGKEEADKLSNGFDIKPDKKVLPFDKWLDEWVKQNLSTIMRHIPQYSEEEAVEYLRSEDGIENRYKTYVGMVQGSSQKYFVLPIKAMLCFLFQDERGKKGFKDHAKKEGISKKQMPPLLTVKELYKKIDKAKKYCVDADDLSEKESAELEAKFFEKFKGQCRPA